MARDFLAVPGVSISAEWLFPSLQHLCSISRISLKAETITQAMCTKQLAQKGMLHVQ
ncbi:hypothetical protein WOLCODRAFT_85264 [Wolfiporia cocos MD-104 SS10]|uniref:HAT C-terminal dimerisation domain-containing protein n=1 Tax=Wolfiporia cocos (strain MD-104) TaxID=742152 RepID=A0A2H3JK02_WOLCO|nr:hypothetical protein WOLCODRAFT_85264 [Wolfiporia cocos MD-104 SS10]